MFDRERADKAVHFIRRFLRHTKGRWDGVPFELQDWQTQLIETLFGTITEDGRRQYRTAYIEIPKKNGKTELGAAVALYLLFADKEPQAEVYSAAADREQASIVYHAAKRMIELSPALAKRCKVIDSTKRVIHNNGSYYRVLSGEAYTKHGYSPHGVIFDELHAQPNRELVDTLTLGSGAARSQPVYFLITTAGNDRHSVCYEYHEYARQVRDGVIEDPTFLPVLYGAGEEDDWTDPKLWWRANPSMGQTILEEDMAAECRRAEHNPALENRFRQLRLNQWVKQESRFIPMHAWDACAPRPELDSFRGADFYGGLDLASTTDIAAFVAVHVDDEGYFNVFAKLWIPQESIEERVRRDKVPYEQWVREGWIEATPGNVVDYRTIRQRIIEFGTEYELRELAYDRWGATQLSQDLDEEGLTVIPFGQGYASMSGPTKELIRLILAGAVRHGGNPVLRWMADNMVVRTDPAGNLKPDKDKSSEKIDGIVALIMALDRAIRHMDSSESVYSERGLLIL
ncbi:MAG: terminase large subunit [Spirochaetaceae bacterium]